MYDPENKNDDEDNAPVETDTPDTPDTGGSQVEVDTADVVESA